MIIGKDKKDEELYLHKTLNRISTLLKEAGDSSESQSKDIKSDRRLLWDSIKELDEIELQHFNANLAMQEKIYSKNREKIRTLRNQFSTPYFARIDFKEVGQSPESIYIGLSSVMEDDFEFLVLDWRSPISNMFYDYEMGPSKYNTPNGEIEGEIILNRQYNIKNGEIKFIHESNSSIHDEGLLSILGSNTSDKMKNIISSIQKKQNEIIRNDKTRVLLIQGVAGSGKTSIAMHRAAFLLYKYRKTLNAKDILIFSPNDIFSEYISDVLPGLGETNISETTLEDFYSTFLPRVYNYEKKNHYLESIYSNKEERGKEQRILSMKFKNTVDFSNEFERFLKGIDSLITNFEDIIFDNKIIVKKSEVSKIFLNKFKNVPIIDRIDSLKGNVFAIVETKYFTQIKEKNSSDFGYNPMDHGNNIQAYLKAEVSTMVDGMFKTLNPIDIYKMFWVGVERKEEFSKVAKLTLSSITEGTVLYEDIIPMLYLKMYMNGFKNYNKIKHVIIDECQDYSALFYKMVNKIFKKASFTILGDINQKISSHTNIDKKEDIKDIFGHENTEIVSLTKSYRSTFEITNFAKNILEFGEPVEGVERHGEVPMVLENVSNIEEEILNTLEKIKSDGFNSIAIITKTAEEANNLFNKLKSKIDDLNLIVDDNGHYNKGITVIPSYIAKGLEFDSVIVPDMDMYIEDSERNLLYTVCTRALHSLYLLSKTKKSILLN